MSVAAGLWVARALGRMAVAEALRDRNIDLPALDRGGALPALALLGAGVPLLFLPPWGGLPLGGYAAIALWLAAAVAMVGPLCRSILRRVAPERSRWRRSRWRRCGTCRATSPPASPESW
jgi:putative ABC transport system permease protein